MSDMNYSEFAEVYEKLYGTSKRLEKENILADFIKKIVQHGEGEWIYLLRGKVWPDYNEKEFGISQKLSIKIISVSFGVKEEEIHRRFRKLGDLGDIAEEFAKRKEQKNLFSSKLTVKKVFLNLRKLMEIEGRGAVKSKLDLISDLLGNASGGEVKYIIRTLLGQLRIGVADAVLRDAIAEAIFPEEKKEASALIESAYDMSNDFAFVLEAAKKGKKALEKIQIIVGRPINVMLPVKVTELKEAFRICGKPAAIEHKYDGFRVLINKDGEEVKLFTRRLENVTKQFPDVVEVVKKYVKGKSFVLDSEVVGYDPKTKKYKPFEAVLQRIKRKYDIDKLEKELPVEVNVFDILYYDGRSFVNSSFKERRKELEKIVKSENYKIRPAKQIVTDDEKVAEKFYKNALRIGEEGIMIKNLNAGYQQGRRIGYIVKLKPIVNDLDLVIVGAEYGSGKRAGWLTSYIVACRDEDKFLEVGKVSSGLKELEGEDGTSYNEMTKLLKPLIEETKGKEVKVKPKIVVSATYQNIQKSPSYSSGFALRFPRITHYRPDKALKEIASLEEVEKEVKRGRS